MSKTFIRSIYDIVTTRASLGLATTNTPTFASTILTGAALTQADVTANTGAAYTIDQANGAGFNLTMNAATPILTLQTAPVAGKFQWLFVRLIQDATGGRIPSFVNASYASGVAPTVNPAPDSITYLSFAGNGQVWTLFSVSQPTDSLTVGGLTVNGTTYNNGGIKSKTRLITAAGAVTVTAADNIVIVNKTSGAATTVNLPAGVTDTVFVIKDGKGDAASNNITITPAAGNIDGAATFVISTNYGSVNLVFNGTQWNLI